MSDGDMIGTIYPVQIAGKVLCDGEGKKKSWSIVEGCICGLCQGWYKNWTPENYQQNYRRAWADHGISLASVFGD